MQPDLRLGHILLTVPFFFFFFPGKSIPVLQDESLALCFCGQSDRLSYSATATAPQVVWNTFFCSTSCLFKSSRLFVPGSCTFKFLNFTSYV